jgi:hypothetical protein
MNLSSFLTAVFIPFQGKNLCPPVQREAFKKENLKIKQIRNTINKRNAMHRLLLINGRDD